MVTLCSLFMVVILIGLALLTAHRREHDIAVIQLLLAALILGLTVGRFLPF